MYLNTATLGFLFATATLIFCFVVAVLWRLMPQERSLPTWIGASSVTFFGGVLNALSNELPGLLSVVVGNMALVWGMGLVFLAARRMLGWPTGYGWDAGVAAGSVLSGILLAVFLDDVHARILIVAVFMAPIMFASAWTFWRGPNPLPGGTRPVAQRTSERLTALLLLAGGLLFVFRAAILLNTDLDLSYSGANQILLALPYAYAVLLSVWLSSVLTLHVTARLQRRLVAANDRAAAANRELRILSRTDPLTQLHNRLHADEILESELHRSRRYQSRLSVVMADLDHFKKVNDRYGHQAGDRVLVLIADVLRNELRKTDSVGRWGGEEFLLILPHTDLDRAVDVAEKVRRAIGETDFPNVGHVTASFGVSSFISGDSALRLLARADEALYEAKRGGRNRVAALAGDHREQVVSARSEDWAL